MIDVEIQELVGRKHPGVVLESPVQGFVFLRQFDQGLACYEALVNQTGRDDRWAGICYFHLHEDMRAVELFYRAIARGVDAARINLAHALGYIERGDEVIPELLRVDRGMLSTYDKVLYFRVKSIHEETSGDLRTALEDAETAWSLVQAAGEFSVLAPDILAQLAVLNGRVGRATAALEYIDRNLAMSSGRDALRARIQRAHILITLGRFPDALADLGELDLDKAPKHLVSIIYVYLAEAEWALGNISSAIGNFEAAVESAAELDIGFEEFLARVGLALLHALSGADNVASEHLRHAERLVGDRSDRLYFRFREILFNRLTDRLTSTEAVNELYTVADELEKMGALQEQGWVKLHVAHELWRSNNPDYKEELLAIANLARLLQNPAILSRELVLLPEFAATAHSVVNAELQSSTLTVHTLDREELWLGSRQIQLPLRRAVELLAYFLAHEAVTLDMLVRDLFPSEKIRTAKSYFHQFRYQLRRHLPGIIVEYDAQEKQYFLKTQLTVNWDVTALRDGDTSLLGKTFLPNCNSHWARDYDNSLDQETATLATNT